MPCAIWHCNKSEGFGKSTILAKPVKKSIKGHCKPTRQHPNTMPATIVTGNLEVKHPRWKTTAGRLPEQMGEKIKNVCARVSVRVADGNGQNAAIFLNILCSCSSGMIGKVVWSKRRVQRSVGKQSKKNCTMLWRNAHLRVNIATSWGGRTTYGS